MSVGSQEPVWWASATSVVACLFCFADSFCALGIRSTLHRIGAIPSEEIESGIVGLTYRVGRHLHGVAEGIRDIFEGVMPTATEIKKGMLPRSILILGRPGIGKVSRDTYVLRILEHFTEPLSQTTLLRDVVWILASELGKKVSVVETSNEIGGAGPVPHPCILPARRMPVERRKQHQVLLEAVENHGTEIVVVDEIGTRKEVYAAKSIAQRGIAMVATAHGISLETLLKDPDLVQLLGGLQSATLGDEEARHRKQGAGPLKKNVVERAGAPIFPVIVEMLSRTRWRVHLDVAKNVDRLLQGQKPTTLLRRGNRSARNNEE